MRIGLITHQWPGARQGGIGTYTVNCARALAEAGHEVHVFTLAIPADARNAGILPASIHLHEVHNLADRVTSSTLPAPLAAAVHAGGEPMYRLALASLLCEQVRGVHKQTSFDIIEAPEYEALGLPLIISPLPGARMITHIHSGTAVVHAGMNKGSLTNEELLFEALEFASLLGVDGLCSPSTKTLRDTQALCPIDAATIVPLPFFPDFAPFSPPNPTAPILYIGRLEFLKGAHLLPEALNLLLRKNPAASIRLAGPDTPTSPSGGSMTGYIREHLDPKLLPRVAFLGEQTRSQLAFELQQCSFVIVPSLFDSYSYVCCESLAAGRTIIVSDNIGATEVVGDAGLTFSRGNPASLAGAMQQLRDNPALLLELSRRAHARARNTLAAEHTTPKRLAFYKTIQSSPRAGTVDERLTQLPTRYFTPLLQAITRQTAFLAGTPDPTLRTPGMRMTAILNAANGGQPTQAILYGAGRHTSRLLAEKHLWESHGHRVTGLIDDHPRFQQHPIHLGLPVISLDAAEAHPPTETIVILSTDTFEEKFWQQTERLRNLGVRVFKLYNS